MDSFLPSIRMLPTLEDNKSPEVSFVVQDICFAPFNGHQYLCEGVFWNRFAIYSSRIRKLSLTSDTQRFGTWFAFLYELPSRPHPLFPRLKTLVIQSSNAGSSAMLKSIASQLDECNISDFENDQESFAYVSIAMANLCMKADRLRHLNLQLSPRLLHSATEHVDKIRGLEDLTIGGSVLPSLNSGVLRFLDRIPGLKWLIVDYECAFPEIASTDIQPTHIQSALQASHELSGLDTLTISGDGYVQYSVATKGVVPSGLQTLDVVFRPTDRARVLLLPHALRIYLERNKNLKKLQITRSKFGIQEPSHSPELLDPYRTDPAFCHSQEFISALAQASQLCEIKIDNIPFPKRNIILEICNVLPNLRNLTRLTLRPSRLTILPNDELQIPRPSVLEGIVKGNPLLEYLSIPIDWTHSLPPINTITYSSSRLSMLSIDGGPRGEFNVQRIIPISRYLDAIFPAVTIVETVVGGGGQDQEEEINFWKGVQDLVRSFQDVAARVRNSHKAHN
ncbi:hypothetical protein MD484_g8505, partial [Candolleomyces efflorescens]